MKKYNAIHITNDFENEQMDVSVDSQIKCRGVTWSYWRNTSDIGKKDRQLVSRHFRKIKWRNWKIERVVEGIILLINLPYIKRHIFSLFSIYFIKKLNFSESKISKSMS